MESLRSKRKLAGLNKKNNEEHPRSNLARDTIVPGAQEDYITQVSEEIEGKVTRKLPQEFSKTESCILAAISRLDEFLLNPLLLVHSRSVPETSRNALNINQGTNEDNSQGDLHPEATVSQCQTTQVYGPDDSYDNWHIDCLSMICS